MHEILVNVDSVVMGTTSLYLIECRARAELYIVNRQHPNPRLSQRLLLVCHTIVIDIMKQPTRLLQKYSHLPLLNLCLSPF